MIREMERAAPPPAAHESAFRPDIEGMRAIAVSLVVLFHAGVGAVAGGYIGVDVFFVVSGFLITSLLLRERQTRGSTSLAGFYARRARRIIPAATVVVIATVAASYNWLGFLRAGRIARDGQWTALFSANVHFAAEGTQYLNTFAPPSPLQHFWSLAVEEQFYLVWPLLFVLLVSAGNAERARLRVIVALSLLVVLSLAWSLIQTTNDANRAFFSPFTRAWEIGAGALLTAVAPALARVPVRLGAWFSWLGIALIAVSALILDESTRFPGYAAALPVAGAVLAIAGGTIDPISSAVRVLGVRPMLWLGKLSYSLYLWHWPLLLIPAQHAGKRLPFVQNLGLIVVALLLSVATFYLVENPVRHARTLSAHPWRALALGLVLVLGTVGYCRWQIDRHQRRPTAAASPSTPPGSDGPARRGIASVQFAPRAKGDR